MNGIEMHDVKDRKNKQKENKKCKIVIGSKDRIS